MTELLSLMQQIRILHNGGPRLKLIYDNILTFSWNTVKSKMSENNIRNLYKTS